MTAIGPTTDLELFVFCQNFIYFFGVFPVFVVVVVVVVSCMLICCHIQLEASLLQRGLIHN